MPPDLLSKLSQVTGRYRFLPWLMTLMTLIDRLSVLLVSVRMLVRGRRPPGHCY
jgi:hypothetical protein